MQDWKLTNITAGKKAAGLTGQVVMSRSCCFSRFHPSYLVRRFPVRHLYRPSQLSLYE